MKIDHTNLIWTNLEKPYLDAYMSQTSSKSVQQLEVENLFNEDR